MTRLILRYPTTGVDETLDARPLEDGRFELATHATYLPLAPGDVVTAADGVITGVVKLEKQHVYEVQLKMPGVPGQMPTVAELEETEAFYQRVHHQTWITRQTSWTFAVSGDKAWLEDRIATDPMVEHCDQIRDTSFAIDFAVAVQHPDLDGSRTGPWT